MCFETERQMCAFLNMLNRGEFMFKRRQLLFSIVLVVISQCMFVSQVYGGEWKQLIGYSLYDLYYGTKFEELRNAMKQERATEIKGTSGLSWPDGRQALVTYLETETGGKRWVYKCIDYFSNDMQQTGQVCYELRE
jgi:hypothetical protein